MVNIQGDEPLLEPEIIDQVVAALQAAPDAVYRLLSKTLFHGSQHLQVPVTCSGPNTHGAPSRGI